MPWTTSDRSQRLPSDWQRRRANVLRRDHHACQIRARNCLGVAREVDHIVPNDDDAYANLQAACTECHRDKTVNEAHTAMRTIRAHAKHRREQHPGVD